MKPTPMQNAALNAVAAFGMLRFFPSDEITRATLAELIERMANKPHEIQWLVQKVLANYDEWPGPQHLRAIFCTRYRPADGIERDLMEGPVYHEIMRRAEEPPELPTAAAMKLLAEASAGKGA